MKQESKGFQQHPVGQREENQLRPFPSAEWDVVYLCGAGIGKLAAAW